MAVPKQLLHVVGKDQASWWRAFDFMALLRQGRCVELEASEVAVGEAGEGFGFCVESYEDVLAVGLEADSMAVDRRECTVEELGCVPML